MKEEKAIDIPPDTIPEEEEAEVEGDKKEVEEEEEEEEELREFYNPMLIEEVDNLTKNNELGKKLLNNSVRGKAPLGSFSELVAFDKDS